MISCGEPSGDLYAGELARALKTRLPNVDLVGMGGDFLRAANARLIGDFSEISVTGLTEALRVLPRSYTLFRRLVAEARACRPDVFVAIDFPDFNFRLGKALKKLDIPIVYYVSPQIWAWRKGRIRTIKKFVDRVLVIFPFEEPFYQREGIDVKFVGHPLIDLAQPTVTREQFLTKEGLDPSRPTIALLPGSRVNEIKRISPVMAAAIPLIRAQVPQIQFVVACAAGLQRDLFSDFFSEVEPPVLVTGQSDDVLAASNVVITASGTATVQAALHERPMIVVYRLSSMTYRIGKPFVSVDTYAMVNLIAGRKIVPELIQGDFTPRNVASEAVTLLTDASQYGNMAHELKNVRYRLGSPGASTRAADAILEIANQRMFPSAGVCR
jgi:lipid-A-disaccharide synthase